MTADQSTAPLETPMPDLDKIAPYPKTAEEATVDNLARHMSLEAHRDAVFSGPRFRLMEAAEKSGENYADKRDLYAMNLALTTAEYGVVFLLHALAEHLPDKADEIAADLWAHWEQAPMEAYTWAALASYEIDPDQVKAAELARWESAQPGTPAPTSAAEVHPAQVPLPLGEEA